MLCDLQGLSHDQAAAGLDWPVGTVKSRQARARARPRDGLSHLGLSAPLSLIAATLASDAMAMIPTTLAVQAASVALQVLIATTGTVATTAAALTLSQGFHPTMWFAPLKLTALAAHLGGGLIAIRANHPGPPPQETPRAPAAATSPAQLPQPPPPRPTPRARGRRWAAGAAAQHRPEGEPGDTLLARPISAEERAELVHAAELSAVEEEFLESGLDMARQTINQLARTLRDNRLRLNQEANADDEDRNASSR